MQATVGLTLSLHELTSIHLPPYSFITWIYSYHTKLIRGSDSNNNFFSVFIIIVKSQYLTQQLYPSSIKLKCPAPCTALPPVELAKPLPMDS
jgi:hypothetical protein